MGSLLLESTVKVGLNDTLDPTPLVPVAPPPPVVQPSHPMTTWIKSGIFKTHYVADIITIGLLYTLVVSTEPKGFKSAAKHLHWLAAMREELNALHANNSWKLVHRPPGTNIVSSK